MFRRPELITFTGVDAQTSIEVMRHLSWKYPIEWGVLFSPKRQGEDPRYPPAGTVRDIATSGLRIAAHLCGRYSSIVQKGDVPHLPISLHVVDRIQVNTNKPRADRIASFQQKMGVTCIAQARGDAFPPERGISWLFDVSGGRGEAPESWPAHPGHHLVGYAGGINPGNVVGVLEAINAEGPYWIDMESGVRTDNVFDLGLCEEVCRLVYG